MAKKKKEKHALDTIAAQLTKEYEIALKRCSDLESLRDTINDDSNTAQNLECYLSDAVNALANAGYGNGT